MSDDERIKNIYHNVIRESKEKTDHLLMLNNQNDIILKTIASKLIPFMKLNCRTEYDDLIKYYTINYNTDEGVRFDAKQEENMKVKNNFERCADKHFGINKLLTFHELDSDNLNYAQVGCNQKCIEEDIKHKDDQKLAECFGNCFTNYYKSSANLLNSFANELSVINNKIKI